MLFELSLIWFYGAAQHTCKVRGPIGEKKLGTMSEQGSLPSCATSLLIGLQCHCREWRLRNVCIKVVARIVFRVGEQIYSFITMIVFLPSFRGFHVNLVLTCSIMMQWTILSSLVFTHLALRQTDFRHSGANSNVIFFSLL